MDAVTGKNESIIDLSFARDFDGEEELGEGDDEYVDPQLITDVDINRCRLLATIRCVEYGTVSTSPGMTATGMLLCVDFAFHPLETRVKEASVELALTGATVAVLQPESIDDDETTETVRKKLNGEFKIGYAPAGVEASIGVERESEREKTSERRIRGSGIRTSRAVWTLRENSSNKKGIHLKFSTVLIVQSQGPGSGLEVDLEIRAKLGPSIGNGLGIRRIITRSSKGFDGSAPLGFRPTALDISETCFVRK